MHRIAVIGSGIAGLAAARRLASAPGGCDAAVAEAMGLRYRNAPGLPGKAAPRTAGEYLGQVIRGLPHWEE